MTLAVWKKDLRAQKPLIHKNTPGTYIRDTAHTYLMEASSAEVVPFGVRDPSAWSSVWVTLGREENTLGATVCCCAYVYSNDRRRSRSEADRTRYEQKKKKHTHTQAPIRTAVAHNIRCQGVVWRPAPRRDSGQGGSRRGIVLCGCRSELLSVYMTKLSVGLGCCALKNIVDIRVHYSCEIRVACYYTKTQPKKELDIQNLPVTAKISLKALQRPRWLG